MIYLWFIIPFVIGITVIFYPFYIHLGWVLDTSDWTLIPTIRVGKDEECYYIILDFLCFNVSIGFSKYKITDKSL